MTVRTITGNINTLAGADIPNATFSLVPESYVFGSTASEIIFGEQITVEADASGNVSFDLHEGKYLGRISTSQGAKSFRLTVDSQGPWTLGRLVGELDPITSSLAAQIFDAVDLAQEWAESPTAPGGAGTKSSKTWAGEAAASATTANAQAGIALNAAQATGKPIYLTYSAADAATLADGDVVQVLFDETRGFQASAYLFTGGALVYRGVLWTRQEIMVESFRTEGLSDALTIDAALDHINDAGYEYTTLLFQPRKTYTIDTTPSIRNINNLTIDLQGAKLRRADSTTTRSFLAADTATNTATISVSVVPSNWRIGDAIVPVTGSADTKAATPRRITAISGTTITLNAPFGDFDGFEPGTPIPSGTKVLKVFNLLVGRPSSTDSASLLTAGINRGIRLINGKVDGNGANQESNSWRVMTEFGIHSEGGEITNVEFTSTAGECVVGHGLHVHHNRFINLAGSAFHTSVNDQTIADSSFSSFTHNFVKNTNTAGNTASGHAEGAITFSWGAGKLLVCDNEFRTGGECILGGVDSALVANPDKWMIFTRNICSGYDRIFWSISTVTEGIVVADNILHDCGDNASMLDALLSNGSVQVSGNISLGNTVLGSTARDVRQAVSRTPITDMHTAVVQWLRGHGASDDTGVNAPAFASMSQHMQVIERAGSAITAYLTNDAGFAGQSYYSPSSHAQGGALMFFDAPSQDFFYRVNGTNKGHRWQSSTNDLMRLYPNKPLELRGSAWGYAVGDITVDGTWSMAPQSGDWGVFRHNAGGALVSKLRVKASGDAVLSEDGGGLIVKSPDGLTTRRIGIDNSGNIVATAV